MEVQHKARRSFMPPFRKRTAEETESTDVAPVTQAAAQPDSPLNGQEVEIPISATAKRAATTAASGDVAFSGYKTLYNKRSLKKRKTYNDGILLVRLGGSTLLDHTFSATTKWKFARRYLSRSILLVDVSCHTQFPKDLLSRPQARNEAEKSSVPDGAFEITVNQPAASDQPRVWIDSFLNKHLRPHQREGVQWMYNKIVSGGGCILADTMGLGKTLQALCLVWVAVSSFGSLKPLAAKCVVACPSSLVGNWSQGTHDIPARREQYKKLGKPSEVRRWLGDRLKFLVAAGDGKEVKSTLQQFAASNACKLVIVSYDQLRRLSGSLACSVDILICDEGHRLKSLKSQTAQQLQQARCKYRVILSGTPLQNDMVRMPRKTTTSSQGLPDCRTSCTHAACLFGQIPCRPAAYLVASSRTQSCERAFQTLVRVKSFSVISDGEPHCNDTHAPACRAEKGRRTDFSSAFKMVRITAAQSQFVLRRTDDAIKAHTHPKLRVLRELLSEVKNSSEDKVPTQETGSLSQDASAVPSSERRWQVVVVSNFTSTLDGVQEMLEATKCLFLRLDGSTLVKNRPEIVESFNNDKNVFALLLSSKAGGVGLNLIGANRLVLMDPDWNPANDRQVCLFSALSRERWLTRFPGAGARVEAGTAQAGVYLSPDRLAYDRGGDAGKARAQVQPGPREQDGRSSGLEYFPILREL
ncbi:snf2 family n-terminal domain-containing protein [Cystoisospora suis]|uniref:Snf2 family n-terminal domain-containing protein n=1 Tax=Cystoisospora suis TaxID=483139 RepID=A0A2C6L7Y4_9APIC|nr:snf2 family n-terminal domain-containing protein [Cystoisospora suis]